MTKSIEELAQGWGVPVEVAENWVDKMADAPEGYERLCPKNAPQLPYVAIYNGVKPDKASGTASFTVGAEYVIDQAEGFLATIIGAVGETWDDDGDLCPISPAALGQFVIKTGGAK